MTPTTAFIALGIVQLIWLIAQWTRHGFLSALNLFAYGVLTTMGYVMHHWVQ